MSLLSELGKVLVFPGALISGIFEQIARRDSGEKICIAGGNVFYAVADLKDYGVDAFYPVQLDGDTADLRVKHGQKQKAMHLLRSWGYECW